VLKYRLMEMSQDDATFVRQAQEAMSHGTELRERIGRITPFAVADGLEAIKTVRGSAAEFGIEPNRIGIMGFSAGAELTAGVAIGYGADSRPDFVAPIYGGPRGGVSVPPDAPPMFVAVADDDPFAVSACVPLYLSWNAAGRPAEIHVYSKGGHGFALLNNGLPCHGWIERFGEWLQAHDLLSPRK
jgi:acetyl esterase/lipase